jgi:GntR family transcriptional regulator
MFKLDSTSKVSIYEQIYLNFVSLITSESLKANEKMPSVREMATILRINPNTIQKAYKLLLAEGYIYSKPGSGNFVSERAKYESGFLDGVKEELSSSVLALKNLGVSKDNIYQLVDKYYEEGKDVKDK